MASPVLERLQQVGDQGRGIASQLVASPETTCQIKHTVLGDRACGFVGMPALLHRVGERGWGFPAPRLLGWASACVLRDTRGVRGFLPRGLWHRVLLKGLLAI